MTIRVLHGAAAAALLSLSPAMAATPSEDMARSWLDAASFGLDVSVGSSSYDAATATASLGEIVIGNIDTDLFAIRIGNLSFEDIRALPDSGFAAHAIRGSDVRVDVHFDVARWFPTATPTVPAKPAPVSNQKPAGLSTEGRAASHAGKAAADKKPDEAPPPDATAEAPPPVIDYSVAVETLLIERPVFPLPPEPLPKDRPAFERFFHIAEWSTSLSADWVEMDNTTVELTGVPDGGDTITTYGMAYISGLHDGRMERSGVNSVEQKPKSEASPLKSLSIDSTYVIGTDIGAALEALNPARFVGGKGDGKARVVYSQYGFSNVEVAFDGGSAHIANMEANNLTLRQTERPVVQLITDAIANPKAIEDDPISFIGSILPNYTQLFGVADVQLSGLEVKVDEVFDFTIRQFDGNGIDGNGIGALTLRDISVNAPTAGTTTQLSLMTFQDIRFGSLMALIDLAKEAQAGTPPSGPAIRKAILDGSTSIGFVELGSLSVETPAGAVGLDTFAITSGDYLKTLPQRADLTFTSLSLPVAMLGDPATIEQMTALGIETLDISGGMTLTWHAETGDLRLDDLTVKAVDIGRLSADVHLAGLPLSLIDKPEEIEARVGEATLVSASTTFGNAGIVEKGFDAQAKKLNQDGAVFRKNTAAALPLMLTFLDDKDIRARFEKPIAAFLNDPRSIRVAIAPPAPVPLKAFETVDTNAPGPLLKLLGLSVVANE